MHRFQQTSPAGQHLHAQLAPNLTAELRFGNSLLVNWLPGSPTVADFASSSQSGTTSSGSRSQVSRWPIQSQCRHLAFAASGIAAVYPYIHPPVHPYDLGQPTQGQGVRLHTYPPLLRKTIHPPQHRARHTNDRRHQAPLAPAGSLVVVPASAAAKPFERWSCVFIA